MKRLFIDANIFIDAIDRSRPFSDRSVAFLDSVFDAIERYRLYTSCDLMTTIYYIVRKHLSNKDALMQVRRINRIVSLVEFGNRELEEAIDLMEKNSNYVDLEDTIQYLMARKVRCDYIVTNDKRFVSGDIPIVSSVEACEVLR